MLTLSRIKIVLTVLYFFIQLNIICAQKTWQITTKDSVEGSMQVLNNLKFNYFVNFNPPDSSIGAVLKIKDTEAFDKFFLVTSRNNQITSALPIISTSNNSSEEGFENYFIRVGSITEVFNEIININKFTFALEFSLKEDPSKKYFTYFNIWGFYDKEKLEPVRFR